MPKPNTPSPEVRERAIRIVYWGREARASQWAAIQAVAAKFGCTPQTQRYRC